MQETIYLILMLEKIFINILWNLVSAITKKTNKFSLAANKVRADLGFSFLSEASTTRNGCSLGFLGLTSLYL